MSEENSTHKAEVFCISKIEKHPQADRLGIIRIDGYVCCVRLGDFKEGDLAVYVCPDSVVPDKPEYNFLNPNGPLEYRHRRIKVKKLRGIVSMGLILKAPVGVKVGDDVAKFLGIEHYEPQIEGTGKTKSNAEVRKTPKGRNNIPKYDLDTWRKYGRLFNDGEEVVCSEKCHGASSKFCFIEKLSIFKKIKLNIKNIYYNASNIISNLFHGSLHKNKNLFINLLNFEDHGEGIHCGSRAEWKKESDNWWWNVYKQCPSIEEFCKNNLDCTLYGEVFGYKVQSLMYGAKQGELFFKAFDILKNGKWMDFDDAKALADKYNVPWVPIIYRGPYNVELMEKLASGNSTIPNANHIREGIVIQPIKERVDSHIGRVKLKLVSNEYLERN